MFFSGGCLPGYSRNLRGTGCTPSSECNQDLWFWPISALLCLAFTLFMLFLVWLPASDTRPFFSWVVPSLSFFVQNISLLYTVGGPYDIDSNIIANVEALFNFHFSSAQSSTSSSWSNLCALGGITTDVEVISFRLVFPAFVIMLLVLLLVIAVAALRFGHWRGFLGDMSRSDLAANQTAIAKKFSAAFLNTLLLLYTTVASVTADLLHCVEVNDVGLRLFLGKGILLLLSWIIFSDFQLEPLLATPVGKSW